ncbi:MAG: HlyC/CorC family transporter [Lachnospiraceae bacterium]|nr:HlyC/CorC family transporter [Lachnospiraceae bacterium]
MEEGSPKNYRFLTRIFGGHQNDEIEDEIISMVNEGHEQGVLHDSEAQMINNIFEFSDKEAKDIMTHRSNIVAIDGNTTLQDAVTFMLNEKNSRYPVYIENIDHIIGIIHVKDAFKVLQEGKMNDRPVKSVKRIIREAKFIPETRNIDSLFRSMQALKNHIVIVIDEYGQTSGLIAMEDILEEIVGNILDEYDEDQVFIQEKGEDTYEIDGLTPLDELEERFSIRFEFENEEFETLNGFLISRLERIPNDDDLFDMDYGGYHFKVLSIENKVIKRVLVSKLKKEKKEQGEE